MAGGMHSRLHPRERDKRERAERARERRLGEYRRFWVFQYSNNVFQEITFEHSSSGSGIQPGWELGRGLDKADATSG